MQDTLQERLAAIKAMTDDDDDLTPQPYMLEGEISLDTLLGFRAWRELFAAPYEPVTAALGSIQANMSGAKLEVFLATWCGDCQRELPRLLHILARVNWPAEQVRWIGVDFDKRDPAGLAVRWQIERVPTLIVMRAGRELGRVVERAQPTLEQDLAALLGA